MKPEAGAKKKTRLSRYSFTLILEELLAGPSTVPELVEHSGMTHRYICALIRTMHAKKVVHIAGWGRDSKGRFGVKVWSLGAGKDAKRPSKPRESVNRDYRARKAGEVLQGTPFAGLLAANDARRNVA